MRLQILKIIANEEECVNFLGKNLRFSQPTISYHLGLLLNFGLVEQLKKAQWVGYRLNKSRLAELMGDFSKLCGILKLQKKQVITHGKNYRVHRDEPKERNPASLEKNSKRNKKCRDPESSSSIKKDRRHETPNLNSDPSLIILLRT